MLHGHLSEPLLSWWNELLECLAGCVLPPTLQIPHGPQEHRNQVKTAGFWLLAKSHGGSESCTFVINELNHCGIYSLNSESFPFPFALKEFVSILSFGFFCLFFFCTMCKCLEQGLYEVKETNWDRVRLSKESSPLASPSCLCVMGAVPFPTTP